MPISTRPDGQAGNHCKAQQRTERRVLTDRPDAQDAAASMIQQSLPTLERIARGRGGTPTAACYRGSASPLPSSRGQLHHQAGPRRRAARRCRGSATAVVSPPPRAKDCAAAERGTTVLTGEVSLYS